MPVQSKDHRPDLKQAVQELLVSQDGGIPLWSQSHSGNASDNEIFRQRASALVEEFRQSAAPRYLLADSKLYSKNGAKVLLHLLFVTRIPGTLKLGSSCIAQALSAPKSWVELNATYRYQPLAIEHYGIEQRWLVIYSDGAYDRATETVAKAQKKEYQRLDKALYHLQARRFLSAEQAISALNELTIKLKYHRIEKPQLIEHKRYSGQGRPKAGSLVDHIEWQIQSTIEVDERALEAARQQRACFIIATNISADQLSDEEVFQAYKRQSSVEHGFRFLKEPVFFTASLFLKKPSRIQGLLMIMTQSLLVYSLAQRHLRARLSGTGQTLPNQIEIPTKTPTLRWIFQMLEGIHQVVMVENGVVRTLIHGLNDLREKILRLFGPRVCGKYQIS